MIRRGRMESTLKQVITFFAIALLLQFVVDELPAELIGGVGLAAMVVVGAIPILRKRTLAYLIP